MGRDITWLVFSSDGGSGILLYFLAQTISRVFKGGRMKEKIALPNNCLNNKCPHHDEHSEENCSAPDDYANSDKCNPHSSEQEQLREKMAEVIDEVVTRRSSNILSGTEEREIVSRILSLPVEGCGEVVTNCHLYDGKPDGCQSPEICGVRTKNCNGTGTISRPLTLGELPDRYRKMREERDKAIQLLTEFMSQVGYTPEDEHYWLHHSAQGKIANIKEFLSDALKEG